MNFLARLFKTALVIMFVVFNLLGTRTVTAAESAQTLRVAPSGSDSRSCGSEAQPCRSIQQAVNLAASGDTILVAQGDYYFPDVDYNSACANFSTTPAVVCIVNKSLTIIGGYSTSNWSTSNPETNPTVIDGGGRYRGVALLGSSATQVNAQLHLQGFTIQNSFVQGASSGSSYDLSAAGGGMFIDRAAFTLKDIVFKNNQAVGGSTSQVTGGDGSGGGLAISQTPSGSENSLASVTFEQNNAFGGNGASCGGFGLGGGLWAWEAIFTGTQVDMTGNKATGGNSYGATACTRAEGPDGLGGGATFRGPSSQITLNGFSATDNVAVGGVASVEQSGNGHGGGIEIENAGQINLLNGDMQSNLAQGAAGVLGGIGSGGAILEVNSNLQIDSASLINNQAISGSGTQQQGAAGGGAIFAMRTGGGGAMNLTINNSIIAANYIELASGPSDPGGGGGGLWIESVPTLKITHSTLAGNRMSPNLVYGAGMILVNFANVNSPVSAVLDYNLVSDHQTSNNSAQAAIHVWSGNTITLYRTLFANNTNDTNSENNPASSGGPGNFYGLESNLYADTASYFSPGSPDYDYHIMGDSPAIDEATGSSATLDIDGESRSVGSAPDLGADEYQPFVFSVIPGNRTLFLNWSRAAALLGGSVAYYQITIKCPSGANPPIEVSCGTPINVGNVTTFLLTGLTNFSEYGVEIVAIGGSGQEISTSTQVESAPSDKTIFLPISIDG